MPDLSKMAPSRSSNDLGAKGHLIDHCGIKLPYCYAAFPASFAKFTADPSDIVICTFPKSGTTFMSAIVHMIRNDADPTCLYLHTLEENVPFIDMCTPDQKDGERRVDLIRKMAPPRIFYTHLTYNLLPESIKEYARVICVARNPKDVLVSLFNHNLSSKVRGFRGSLDDMAELFTTGNCQYAPYFSHIESAWNNRNNPNVFFTTYERLLADFKPVVYKLGVFLGTNLDDKQLDTIAHHCNFDNMKKHGQTNRSAYADVGYFDFNVAPFMRKGKVGGWKNDFSPALNDKMDKWIEEEEERLKENLAGFSFEYAAPDNGPLIVDT